MVCTLEPWQDLVFTDSTFGPDTACFQNNMSFQSTVIGCETWIITKDMAAKLSAFATSCCRIMLNIKCLHKVSNHRVYDLNGISQLSYCGMATFCAWRRMDQLTFYFVWAHPPPPLPPAPPNHGKRLPGRLHKSFPAKSRNGSTQFFLWHRAHCPRPSQLKTTFNWLLSGWTTMMSHTWISWSISALDLNGHPLVLLTSKNFK